VDQVNVYQVNPDLGRMNNAGIGEAVVRDPYVESGAGADGAGSSGYGVAALLAVRFVVNPVVQSLAVSRYFHGIELHTNCKYGAVLVVLGLWTCA